MQKISLLYENSCTIVREMSKLVGRGTDVHGFDISIDSLDGHSGEQNFQTIT